jgi:transcriptional regulator with XRE-family HTH domain
MAGKKSDLGPIGVNVQNSVKSFREARRLSFAELSRQLADMGRDIPPLGLRRIESGDRKVDVDDLVALALALGVSPLALLLPVEASSIVAQGDQYDAMRIWEWARGHRALAGDPLTFMRDSNPLDWAKLDYLGDDLNAALLSTSAFNDAVARRTMRSAASAADDLMLIEYTQRTPSHFAGDRSHVDDSMARSLIAEGVAQEVSRGND